MGFPYNWWFIWDSALSFAYVLLGAVKYVAGFVLSLIVLELRYRALFPYTKGPCARTV